MTAKKEKADMDGDFKLVKEQKSPKRGRPPVVSPEMSIKFGRQLMVRFPKKLYPQIQEAALNAGLPISTWARLLLLKAARRARKVA